MDNKKLELLMDTVKKNMNEKRFNHTLGVYNESIYFSKKMSLSNEDEENLLVAALLHDITKQKDIMWQRELCKNEIKDFVYSSDDTLHQNSGAIYARSILGDEIVNDAVYSAISKHTTGAKKMSLVDYLLFIADYTEEGRYQNSCKEMRAYLHSRLDNENRLEVLQEIIVDTAKLITKNTIDYLKKESKVIDSRTLEML